MLKSPQKNIIPKTAHTHKKTEKKQQITRRCECDKRNWQKRRRKCIHTHTHNTNEFAEREQKAADDNEIEKER